MCGSLANLSWLVVAAVGSGCAFEAPGRSPDAAPTPDSSASLVDASPIDAGDPTAGGTIRIEVRIDGRSHLVLKGDRLHWLHLENAAPGRHNAPPAEPTSINDQMWFPTWPDDPDVENRDCNCASDTFTGVTPPIPRDGRQVSAVAIQARGLVQVVAQPGSDNDFTATIEIDDNGVSSSAVYIVEIEIPGDS